jgi:serine/threonine protein kinase
MNNRRLDEEAIFHIARQLTSGEARATYLDQVCAGDASLRERVEALLGIHEQEPSFLNSGSPNLPPTAVAQPLTERPGATIGRYRLMEQIGEGGMGTVFVAEQERPIRRKVAIKVIKPGMDSKAVVARFEAERQALALMDHPNIARALDAGATESGRPYFVMELVRGIAVTEYCDAKRLTIRERLDLFIQVCQAIQHAHQKGIIHRDIKPTNVLVTEQDGKAIPKVIDFGVAKALGQRLTERTIYTSFQGVLGTPLYMSPEQAALSAVDADTRSDVYSLGVLLYELLTGVTPLDKGQIEQAACDEIWRMVREHEPAKPSTKVGTLGQTATSVSACRQTVPERLALCLRGDLDWVVMKALEKDRSRRYETASAFAADIGNYLNSQPVAACPPSAIYRLRKFTLRNRVAMVTAALVLASLVLGMVAAGCMAVIAAGQARRAEDALQDLQTEIELKRQTIQKLAEAYYGDAVAAVLSGDYERGKGAIELARQTKRSDYRLAVLDGLAALNNGEPKLAVQAAIVARDVEPSAEDPDRVGALALYATACVWVGYDDLAGPELSFLQSLKPRSETDLLLKAYALSTYSADESWTLLQDTPRIRCSPLGLWIKANRDAWEASETGSMELTEEALEEYKYVDTLFRDHPFALNGHLQAFVGAIERAPSPADKERYIEQGRQLTKKLEGRLESDWGDWPRWMFYRAVGEPEKATDAIRRVGRTPTTYCWFYAADCLGRQDAPAALEEFSEAIVPNDQSSKYVRLSEARLVSNTVGSANRVRQLVQDLLDDPSPLIRRNALLSLYRACPTEFPEYAAQAAAVRSQESTAGFDPFGEEAMVQYLAGRLPEEKLLEQATRHRLFLANAHFTIGMVCLATGRHEEAREHLEKAATPRAFDSFDYAWAKAYLMHLIVDVGRSR